MKKTNKKLAVLSDIGLFLMFNNLCNSQKWFEGEALYSCTAELGNIHLDNVIETKVYYKDGNILSKSYTKELGESTNLFNYKEQTYYNKFYDSKITTKKVSEYGPINVVEIDRNIVVINGHKCIKVVTSTTDNEYGESTSIDWVDESYNIPYNAGRIAEVPKGLIVKNELTIKSLIFNSTSTKELKEIKETKVSDSKFKL